MNYIQQAYNSKFATWKYVIPCVGFFGLMWVNYLLMNYMKTHMGMDVEQLLQERIEEDGSNWALFESLSVFAVFLAGLFFWVRYVHIQSITSLTTSRPKIDWKRVFFAFLLWGGITSGLTIVGFLVTPEDFVVQVNWSSFLVLALISIVLIPIQTSFEEYFFRGYLMQAFGVLAKNRWFPLLSTSVIFGLMHIVNPEVNKLGTVIMVYYIGTGLYLGIMTLMDEGLELALGFHAANNLFTALLVTADWTAFQTESILRFTGEPTIVGDVLVPVLVLFPIVIYIFAKKYQWSNWKEKLLGPIEKPE